MTFNTHMTTFALATVMLGMAAASQAQTIITYDNTTTPATGGFSSTDLTRTWGDSLNMASGGLLDTLSLSLFNSSSANTGAILAGTFTVNIYDNTTAYTGGSITGQPLLGSFTGNATFGAGLSAGFFTLLTFTGLSSLNINLTQNVLITQSFSQTAGTSLRYGVVGLGNPTVGSSPNTYYLRGATVTEGLYTSGTNPGQFAYKVGVVPEPASMTALGLGVAAMMRRRRNRK